MTDHESSDSRQRERPGDASGHRKLPDYGLVGLGIFLLFVPLGFVAVRPDLYPNLALFLRVIVALGGALVGAAIPGLIEVSLPFARGAGAMAVFLIIYVVNPPEGVTSSQAGPGTLNDRGALGTTDGDGEKCLDVSLPDFQSNAAKVQVWTCHDGVNQQWRFDEFGRLVNGGGKCLDVSLPHYQMNAAKVQVWDCHDGVNQQWHLDGLGRLVNGGGKCLDARLPAFRSNGAKIQVWDCHEGVNQQWHFDEFGRLVNGGGST